VVLPLLSLCAYDAAAQAVCCSLLCLCAPPQVGKVRIAKIEAQKQEDVVRMQQLQKEQEVNLAKARKEVRGGPHGGDWAGLGWAAGHAALPARLHLLQCSRASSEHDCRPHQPRQHCHSQ
jgi:hypothetical protein